MHEERRASLPFFLFMVLWAKQSVSTVASETEHDSRTDGLFSNTLGDFLFNSAACSRITERRRKKNCNREGGESLWLWSRQEEIKRQIKSFLVFITFYATRPSRVSPFESVAHTFLLESVVRTTIREEKETQRRIESKLASSIVMKWGHYY